MSVTLIDPYRFAGFDSDYELITTTTLSTSTASVTFSNLGDYSSTYKHLQVRGLARSDNTTSSTANDGLWVRLNSDTGNNYAWHRLFGNGSSAGSDNGTTTNWMLSGIAPRSGTTANVFAAAIIDLLDVYSTSKNKTLRSLSGASVNSPQISLQSGLWMNTASVTSITILPDTSKNFVSGSRFSLYGIK
jgi:hypothetical protein